MGDTDTLWYLRTWSIPTTKDVLIYNDYTCLRIQYECSSSFNLIRLK